MRKLLIPFKRRHATSVMSRRAGGDTIASSMSVRFLISALAVALTVSAQTPAPRPNTYRSGGGASTAARLISPELHPDRTVTFRIRAPQANEVSLSMGGAKKMTKDESGLWTITVGPLDPEIYEYSFTVDGARVLDIANPSLKTGRQISANLLDVPGTPQRFDQEQDVPHGAID